MPDLSPGFDLPASCQALTGRAASREGRKVGGREGPSLGSMPASSIHSECPAGRILELTYQLPILEIREQRLRTITGLNYYL